MTTTSSWEPILSDALVADSRSALEAIVEDVCGLDVETQSPAILGDAALLFGYMSLIEGSDKWQQLSFEYLERAIEKTSASHGMWPGLYGGICGVGWTVEHLSRLLDGDVEIETIEEADDPIDAIDAHFIGSLQSGNWRGPYDLISGLVGFGAYFLERLPRRSAQSGIRLVLRELHKRRENSWGGSTWHTPPQEIPYHQLLQAPDGYYNLGVAHGVPGVIKLLAEAIAAGVDEPGSVELLEDSVRWLFSRERPPQAMSRYSSWFVPGSEGSDTRVAWCYGDLGIGAVLFGVGTQLGKAQWREAGEALLTRCAGWPSGQEGINDAPICHGAIGGAHIFNRIYQSTRDELFKRAANRWYEHGLAFRRPGEGVGGFFSYTPDRTPIWSVDYTLLSGGVGIALALISAMYPILPQWDRVLLLSDFARTRNIASVAA